MKLFYKNNSYSLNDSIHFSSTHVNTLIQFCKRWLSNESYFEISTSGSTGTPQKIVLSRESIKKSVQATVQALQLNKTDRAVICLDVNYIAGMMMAARSLEVGMDMVIVEPASNPFIHWGKEIPASFIALTPHQVKTILQSEQKKYFNTLKVILVGGAPLDQTTQHEVQPFTAQFYETYGMTETISHIALRKINILPSPYFETLPGISIRQDARNCLCIKTPYLTSELITNDEVVIHSPNQFEWIGRWDNVINSGGIKLHPELIERKIYPLLMELNMHQRFFITGLPNGLLGQAVTMIIEGEKKQVDETAILHHLKKWLPKYEVPKSIVLIPHFIETDTQKINRKKTLALIL